MMTISSMDFFFSMWRMEPWAACSMHVV